GAALFAALEEAKKAAPGTVSVTIFPDSSERYLSKGIYEGGKENETKNNDDTQRNNW
ncbi:hypothetical protein ACOJ2L_19820, partial [Bacillus pumilus]